MQTYATGFAPTLVSSKSPFFLQVAGSKPSRYRGMQITTRF